MPNTLSLMQTIHKNRIEQFGAYILLLEIKIDANITIRLAHNNEDITWNGELWQAFPFQISEITNEDAKGELPQFSFKVAAITGDIPRYIEVANGAPGAEAILRLVHSEDLSNTTPILEYFLSVKNISVNKMWVDIKVGPDMVLSQRRPYRRFLKNHCPYRYGDVECGVSDATKTTYPTCPRTLADCIERGNGERFGGEFALPGGVYVD